MKVEVTFIGNSLDVDTYEEELVSWVFSKGQLSIYSGTDSYLIASYAADRIVRVRVIK